ncbi:Protein phosphatase 2C [Prauserella marina]|uniref:Protein phosphatase 2C n=1 Tax=Prauserella marina TaxID=530584 RepID=A0A1G6NP13_9PSEU|nr:protein phosphatase 2C-like protein [Prauserella marina]SDC69114.1 Protein phosphatase 2C [Prauserella marina]
MTDQTTIVLDGASAFVPVDVPTEAYVDTLGQYLVRTLAEWPQRDTADVVAESISATAHTLRLVPGASPSSTVSIVRRRENTVDLFALGDSAIYYGRDDVTSRLCDNRIAELGIAEHREYRERLAQGHGYDDQHRELLKRLQLSQRRQRNQPGGYWIAEADPEAARNALVRTLDARSISWALLATDGAYGPITHLGLDDWPNIAGLDSKGLATLLQRCASWETEDDSHGKENPRAKVADDKALAAVILTDL